MKPASQLTPSPAAAGSSDLVGRMALRFGVAGGLLCASWMLGLYATGNNPFGPKVMLAQLVVPLLAVAAEWRLRQRLAPEKPGIGRQLTLGGLVVLLAALISASSVVGLASGAGEKKLVDLNRREAREITLAELSARPKQDRNSTLEQQQLAKIAQLSIADFAISNFTVTLLFGLALAVPGGIFFRE
ncbi:DUF4199 family protein [Hymenobacter sp. RP-2-7]|uniref:DUF4199 family protein n=1 Tax=Hymenobacter polaris TaxID=2682546 RepID=A0A7Y0AIP5_9BACT|nr:DUF4199 domain-containing protein [Hymenobacter polaris]NML68004.1 DUF4199 family protein [Hymenobacter polaris]